MSCERCRESRLIGREELPLFSVSAEMSRGMRLGECTFGVDCGNYQADSVSLPLMMPLV